MVATVRIGDRVTLDRRAGCVEVILSDPRRGLPGARVTDVQVRFDDGAVQWVNPDDLTREPVDERT